MESKNKKLLNMNYEEVVLFLIKKYGQPKKSYFHNQINWNKDSSLTRTKEGLVIHHIDEDKAIMLSHKKFAYRNPWKFQLPERLVYCNLLEHLILHIKIIEYPNAKKNRNEAVGIGGIINFLIPELNDMYSGIEYKPRKGNINYKTNLARVILPHKDDYFLCLKEILYKNVNVLVNYRLNQVRKFLFLFLNLTKRKRKKYAESNKIFQKFVKFKRGDLGKYIKKRKEHFKNHENEQKIFIYNNYFKQSFAANYTDWKIENNTKLFDEIFKKIINPKKTT